MASFPYRLLSSLCRLPSWVQPYGEILAHLEGLVRLGCEANFKIVVSHWATMAFGVTRLSFPFPAQPVGVLICCRGSDPASFLLSHACCPCARPQLHPGRLTRRWTRQRDRTDKHRHTHTHTHTHKHKHTRTLTH